jgi:uncharacterized protein YqjF (DUF2071 family)
MLQLKSHPFAVEALLARTTVLTFAVPAPRLQLLLPECLTLDTFGEWGFVAVALVQTHDLRPQGLPAWLGQNFFLIGYRLFVRYTTAAGKRLRGLYILRSETDKQHMALIGNLLTSYHYATVDIRQARTGNQLRIESKKASLQIVVDSSTAEPPLPPGSPFSTWQEARRFAGPLPFTFSYHAPQKEVVIVEGVREYWKPQPVLIETAHVGFLGQLGLQDAQLASAFTMANIPYCWKKGRTEQWPA